MNKKRWLLALAAVAVLTVAIPALAGQSELASVRRATARYHSVAAAEAYDYVRFLACFDSPDGGMGQHYVNMELLGDGTLDPLRPEAMVYEVRDDKLKLVAVEWVLPGLATDPAPTLFGNHFHYNPTLEIWALHAWIWSPNPSGMFADWNPDVAPCPAVELPAWLP